MIDLYNLIFPKLVVNTVRMGKSVRLRYNFTPKEITEFEYTRKKCVYTIYRILAVQ